MWDLEKAIDTSIYEEALNTMMEREPDEELWRELMQSFEENNK